MIKKDNLYYPSSVFRKRAWVKNAIIYKEAEKSPIKFWEKLAKQLIWRKKWKKAFSHKPPYFKWFAGGKINIVENCLDRHIDFCGPDCKICKDGDKKNEKIALIWEPEPLEEKAKILTYRELLREVCKFASALKKLGVKRGDRVGIYLPMIPEAVISMLACARIGAVHAVVFSAFSPQALKARLEDTGAKILITADGYFRRGQVINLKQSADAGVKETKVAKIIVVKRAGNEISWQAGRDFWFSDLVKDEKEFVKPAIMDAEDPLFILYTSGSTGKPKGILHTCAGYAVQAEFTAKWIFDLKEDDVFWSTADLGWITGHTYSCYGPLLNGATFIIFEGAPDWPSPDRWCQIIEKYKVTTFYTAPTAIRMFEKYGSDIVKKRNLDSLQILGSVGEPIDESAWQWYFKEIGKEKCPLVDTWWQTELGGILISSLPGVGPFKPTFTGLPFPGLRFDVLDDNGKSLPPGKEGNLVILPPFSPGMFRGVYRNPEKYSETYWNEYGKKIYFTSDAAFKDSKGLIRIVGRVDDVIKVAGHRLTTGELENAVAKHPDIPECAVVGIPDQIKGEAPVVFAVLNKERPVAEIKSEVAGQIKKEIGPIALPKEVYIVGDLPKTRSGKIMRRILKRLFTGEELGDLSTLANPEIVGKIKQII